MNSNTAESLCWNCYNEILAKKLHAMGIRMEAAEDHVYDYKFEMDDELDCDQHLLFEKLVKKVKRGLETTYIKEGIFPNGQHYQTMRGDLLVGRIESSENEWDIPILVIDGQPYSWNEVGKMLMSNEGFQIRIEVFDMTDDVE